STCGGATMSGSMVREAACGGAIGFAGWVAGNGRSLLLASTCGVVGALSCRRRMALPPAAIATAVARIRKVAIRAWRARMSRLLARPDDAGHPVDIGKRQVAVGMLGVERTQRNGFVGLA